MHRLYTFALLSLSLFVPPSAGCLIHSGEKLLDASAYMVYLLDLVLTHIFLDASRKHRKASPRTNDSPYKDTSFVKTFTRIFSDEAHKSFISE